VAAHALAATAMATGLGLEAVLDARFPYFLQLM
jgi:hypothetical protein